MIKNIIIDVGGVLADDSKENLRKILGDKADFIYKKAYGKGFDQCLLGNMSVDELKESLANEVDFLDVCYVLDKKNLKKTYPIMWDNVEYFRKLRNSGYKIYLLSNMTEDSYNYLNSEIDFESSFDGGVYSYLEHVMKPSEEIYKILIDRYNLKASECLFFDDREKNIIGALKLGINGYVFKSIDDVSNNL